MVKNKEVREREMTFVVENIDELISSLLLHRKEIRFNGRNYVLEKGKLKEEIQFLIADNYSGTRFSDGIRHRIKLSYKNDIPKFVYNRKKFLDGHRYENSKRISDIRELDELIKKLPNIDAIMIKNSLKYIVASHAVKSGIILRVDCCYSINPERLDEISAPFFYLEIEELTMGELEGFVHSDVFRNVLKPLLKDMPEESFNRLRKCQSYWKSKSVSHEYILKAIHSKKMLLYLKNNYFDQYTDLYLRGSKKAERGNKEEKEYKFVYENMRMDKIVNSIQLLVGNEYSLIKTAPRIINDVYIDCENILLDNEMQFRLRKRKREEGWIACFKSKKEDEKEPCLVRNKVRTMVSTKAVLQFLKTGCLDGNAFSELEKHAPETKGSKLIKPAVLLVQYRDRYVLRRKYDENVDNYSYKMSDLVHVIFDNVCAIDLSDSNYVHYLKNGEMVIDEYRYKCVNFCCGEIEPNTRTDVEEVASNLFEKIIENLEKSELVKYIEDNKYKMAKMYLYEES